MTETHLGSTFHDFLNKSYKGCHYATGETYESLQWMSDNTISKPTLEECQAGIADYEANYDKYKAEEILTKYPSYKELCDMLYESMQTGEIAPSKAFVNRMLNVER